MGARAKRLKQWVAAVIGPLVLMLVLRYLLVLQAPRKKLSINIGLCVGYIIAVLVLAFSKMARCVYYLAFPALVTSRLRAILCLVLLYMAFESFHNAAVNATRFVEQSACANARFQEVANDLDGGLPFSPEAVYDFYRHSEAQFKQVKMRIDELDKRLDELVTKYFDDLRLIFDDCDAYFLSFYYQCTEALEGFPDVITKNVCELLRNLTTACDAAEEGKRQAGRAKEAARETLRAAIGKVKESASYQLAKETIETLETSVRIENSYSVRVKSDLAKLRDAIRQKLQVLRSVRLTYGYILNAAGILLIVWPFYKAWRFAIAAAKERQEVNKKLRPNAMECARITQAFYFTTMALAMPLLFLTGDWMVYAALGIVNLIVKSAQLGLPSNEYQVQVSRSGFVNRMLANLVDKVGPILRDANEAQWRECFHSPTAPSWIPQLVLALVCLVLCPLQVYASRLKPPIYEFFKKHIDYDGEEEEAWP